MMNGGGKYSGINIVKASAGSGKTYNLACTFVKIYLNLIKESASPFEALRNILAITFTNKAAEEMKNRIISLLKKLYKGEGEECLPLDTDTDPKELAEKALEGIFTFYSSFNVKTIDSFMAGLLNVFKPEVELPPDVEIDLDSDYYTERSIEDIFSDFVSDSEPEPALKRLIETTINEGEGWDIVEVSLPPIKTMFNFIKHSPLAVEKIHNYKEDEKEIEKFFKDYHELLRQSGKESNKNIEKRLSWYRALKDHKLYYPLMERVISGRVNRAREEGKIIIDELPSIFDNLMQQGSIPFIYYKLEEKYRYILIDEFQDTNEIQWKSLYPLIENSLSEGGFLYLVGDRKQAIYRWRGGRAELIDEIEKDSNFIHIDKRIEFLSKNYRSFEEIVKFNNTLFSEGVENYSLFEKSPDIKKVYEYRTVRQEVLEKNRGKGYVEIRIINPTKKDASYEELIDLLKDIKERRGEGGIGILLRKNSRIREVVELLNSKGYRAISSESMYLGSHPGVRSLLSLLRYLNAPDGDIWLKRFVLGELFLKLMNLDRETVEEKIMTEGITPSIMGEKFKKEIDGLKNKVDLVPLYNLVFSLMKLLNVWENFPEDEMVYSGFLEVVHRFAGDTGGTLSDFLKFWEEHDGRFSLDMPEVSKDRELIEVLTFHKAKGLEFDVVIIPHLKEPFKIDLRGGNHRKYFSEDEGKILYRVLKKGELENLKEDKIYNDGFRKENARNIQDQLNLLYVGLTRAREELYMIIDRKKTGETWAQFIINFVMKNEEEFKKKKRKKDIGEVEIYYKGVPMIRRGASREERYEPHPPSVNFHLDWEASLVIKKHSPDEIIYARKGEEIHRVLSFLGNLKDEEELDEILKSQTDDREIIEDVKRFVLSEPIRRWFFVKEDVEIWKEREIVDKNGDILRPDRVLFFKDRVCILDFKTGEEREEHREQMKKYMDTMKRITNGRVEGYLLYFPHAREVEVR